MERGPATAARSTRDARIEAQLHHQRHRFAIRSPRFGGERGTVIARQALHDTRMIQHDAVRLGGISSVAREQEPLRWRREGEHDVDGGGLAEARRRLERRDSSTDRPQIDVIAARRLLTVGSLPCPLLEERGIAFQQLLDGSREA